MRTHYSVLGVARDADLEQIRAAYRNLAKKYHPDLNHGDSHAAMLFNRIHDSYNVLSDPFRRGLYDAQLRKEDENLSSELNARAKAEPVRSGHHSFSRKVAQLTLIGTIVFGATLVTVTYLGAPKSASSRKRAPEPIAFQVSPATAAEMPTAMARLFVAGGQAPTNFAVQLVIAIQGSVAPDASIMVHGLPVGASLSAGQSTGPGDWRVPVSDLFNISIIPPQDYTGTLDLSVELRSANDLVVDRHSLRVWWVTAPGTANPSASSQPSASPPPPPTPSPPTPQSSTVAVVPGGLPPPVIGPNTRIIPFPGAAAPQSSLQLAVVERRSSTVSVGKTSNLVTAFRDCPLCPEMAQLKGGSFMMGSNDDPSEKPVHRVTLKPFALARYPVTVKEWRQCVTAKKCTAEAAGEDDTPVRNLSFEDAEQYVAWLSQTTQQKYRLPAEAEWEYAARAKTATKYWWGNEFVKGMGNCQGCGEPYFENSPTKVGSFAANPLGFYDMAGGVAQWVSDCWHPAYSGAPSDGSSWDAPNCGERILRGGSWLSDASSLRAANRDHYDAAVRYPTHGLRVARSAPDGQQIVSGD